MSLDPFTVRITEGWKAKENGRVGAVVEIHFSQSVHSFAPTLDDLNRLAMVITLVRNVDSYNKKMIEYYKEADRINLLKGELQCL